MKEIARPADQAPMVRAERLDLLIRQSSRAAYTGILMAFLLAAILWYQADRLELFFWILCVIFSGLARIALYISYGRSTPAFDKLPGWERAYLATLMVYFATWGFGGLFLQRDVEPLYQVAVAYFLIGMAGSAISVFSANRLALVSSTFLLMTPLIIWLYVQGEMLTVGMGLGATAFLLSSLYAARILSTSLQQNLEMKHDLIAAKKESDQLTTALESALGVANEASNAKTRFLASASHDLRQPIHALSLLSSSLSSRTLDDKSERIAKSMQQSIGSLSRQLDTLLDVSKLDAGVVKAEVESFNLNQLLRNLQLEMSTLSDAADIEITLDCPQPCMVHTDPILLERIVRNLVSNTVAHNHGCTVSLAVTRENSRYALLVQDTGKGIAPEEQGRIFEEFYQLDNPTRDQDKGLGLGLAIVSRLQTLLNLDMQFESALGQGVRYVFTVPSSSIPDSPEQSDKNTVQRFEGLRILAVDDEANVREGMLHILETLGCEAKVAATANEAVEISDAWQPHAVFVDFRLSSSESGVDVIRRLRLKSEHLPAYLVTGDKEAASAATEDSKDIPVLHKPLGGEELRTVLEKIMAQLRQEVLPSLATSPSLK
ncbi:hybrid sensor histidine kinase/response regulator [Parahalioglobus pacificus]|nr:hybrid sensor histidine kinase/response regulator [Halioglobus pacificus]